MYGRHNNVRWLGVVAPLVERWILDRDFATSNKFPLLPWEISFTPRDLCLSDDTLLVVGSFYLVCMQAKD